MAKSGGGDRHVQACVAGMVLIRFFLGGYFLYDAVTRLMHTENFTKSLANATNAQGKFVLGSVSDGYANFLLHAVHPHAEVFAWLVMLLSALAGVLLVFGFLTRLAAGLAMLVSLFFLLATYIAPAPNFGFHAAFLVMELSVLIAAAGRTCGIDALVARNSKWKILW